MNRRFNIAENRCQSLPLSFEDIGITITAVTAHFNLIRHEAIIEI